MKRRGLWWLLAIIVLLSLTLDVARAQHPMSSPAISYVLSMPQPQTHFFEVELRLSNLNEATLKKQGFFDVKMPVWTPGSYLVREYAKNMEGFVARSGAVMLNSQKISKNTWRIQYTGQPEVRVFYKVYAYELTVRTSFLDAEHGYVNGASMFVYVPQFKDAPATLTVRPFTGWNVVSTALVKAVGADFTYPISNYDVLVDSPLEIGTHRVLRFEASGVPHEVAQFGETKYDEKRLLTDYKRVTETAASIIGEHPCKNYTFIVHHLPVGGGGLEHQNSTSLQTSRTAYATEAGYIGFMGLVAHEYFHLWNVKRIRPKALGPFDYDNENYTHLLWVAEGITSMYDNYILRRSGLTTPEKYLEDVAGDINGTENAPGGRVQSLTESSWDAWIKYYRPNENSPNSTISYYTKGAVIATLLNLEIMHSTNGDKSFDDVMRLLWNEYYKKQGLGFTDDEMQKAVETIAGHSLDDFFRSYIWGTDAIDYNRYFGYVGCRLMDYNARNTEPFLGVNTSGATGKLTVSGVVRDSPAWKDGLSAGDEIISVDGVRVSDDVNKLLLAKKPGDVVTVQVSRAGLMKTLPVTLTNNPKKTFKIERVPNATATQEMLYKKWLYLVNQ
ncbi:MAG: PDZ domain-containing protein [Cytophagaceae bacterium]|nr:PDZ domain-containing protein [Cytophagaceae bacterium]